MLILVLLDAGLSILFPLFIGFAIDDALLHEYNGAILLGLLGLLTLLVGAGRRFYDSRFYGRLYRQLGIKVGNKADGEVSAKSAHLGFLREVVEFLENSMPEIVNILIGLVGTLVIIATMDLKVLLGCLIILAIVMIVYGTSQNRTVRFNKAYNDEQERQVSALSSDNPVLLHRHLERLMRWNIKLSDLETINFSVTWLSMMAFLVYAIVSSAGHEGISHGTIFSLVLYVFQFIENVTMMPFFYQQWLRLTEITKRLQDSAF